MNYIRRWKLIFSILLPTIMLLEILGISGCSPKNEGQISFAYSVTDSKGMEIHFQEKPHRILTLGLGTDEILLDLVNSDRIAALNSLAYDEGICPVAEKAGAVKEKMKDYNLEHIISLQPDLVIAPPWSDAALVQGIRDAGISVYIPESTLTIAGTKKAVLGISEAVGEVDAGKEIIQEMETDLKNAAERIEKIPEKERKKVVLYSHMHGYEGKDSYFDEECRYAGLVNGAASIGLGKTDPLSKENIIRINPDYIFIPTWTSDHLSPEKAEEELTADPAYGTVKAVRNGHLVQVEDKYMYCAGHYVTKAILQMIDRVYG